MVEVNSIASVLFQTPFTMDDRFVLDWYSAVILLINPFSFVSAKYEGNRFITVQDNVWKVSCP